MAQVTLELPDDLTENEAKFQLAVRLFQIGKVSCGKAAEIAGYTKPTFMELLSKQGIPVFNYTSSEFEEDLRHV